MSPALVQWCDPPISPCEGNAGRIIDRFGGLSALARLLGHKHPTTVQGWKERGFIPAKHQAAVLAKAREIGVELTPDDFFLDSALEAAE